MGDRTPIGIHHVGSMPITKQQIDQAKEVLRLAAVERDLKIRDNLIKLFVKRFGKPPQVGMLIQMNFEAYASTHWSRKDNTDPVMVQYQIVDEPYGEFGAWRIALESTNKLYRGYIRYISICQADLKKNSLWKE